jgi:hypothetical protein
MKTSFELSGATTRHISAFAGQTTPLYNYLCFRLQQGYKFSGDSTVVIDRDTGQEVDAKITAADCDGLGANVLI